MPFTHPVGRAHMHLHSPPPQSEASMVMHTWNPSTGKPSQSRARFPCQKTLPDPRIEASFYSNLTQDSRGQNLVVLIPTNY